MKRKILASLMCLLMMATLLPVGSMAAETSFLTNGDFEGGVDSNGIPNGWTEFDRDTSDAVYSSKLIEGEDTPAEGVTAVTPHNGASFKIEGNVDYYQKLNNLVEGKKYLVEGYVNAPVNIQGPAVCIGRGNYALNTATYAVSIFSYFRNGVPDTSTGETLTTDGWLRFTNVFQYSPDASNSKGSDWYLVLRNLNDNPVYYDSISITEVSDNVLFCEQFNTFANDKENNLKPSIANTDAIPSYVHGYTTAIDSDKNGVLEILTGTWNQKAVSLNLDPVVTGSSTIRISFRAKRNAETAGSNDANVCPYPSEAPSHRVYLDFTQNDGDWTYYEFIFDYTNGSWNEFRIYKGTIGGGTWYLDDLVIEKVGDAFVGEGKTLTAPQNTVFTKPEGLTITSRQFLDAPVSASETVKPFVRFATAEANGDTALTMTAVYKNEGSKRQLLHVITENLNATASAAAYSTKSIDLSTLGLTAADGVTYTAETYLWDEDTLKPIVDKVEIPITVAQ